MASANPTAAQLLQAAGEMRGALAGASIAGMMSIVGLQAWQTIKNGDGRQALKIRDDLGDALARNYDDELPASHAVIGRETQYLPGLTKIRAAMQYFAACKKAHQKGEPAATGVRNVQRANPPKGESKVSDFEIGD